MAQYVGGDSADVFTGTAGADTLTGNGGADVLRGDPLAVQSLDGNLDVAVSPDTLRAAFYSSSPSGGLAVLDFATGALSFPLGTGQPRGPMPVFSPNGAGLFVQHDNQVKVFNFADQMLTVISSTAGGVPGNGASRAIATSADGSRVLIESLASNLVAGDSNAVLDVFVKDLSSGAVVRANVSASGGQAFSPSFAVDISADGTKVLFRTSAGTLVPGDEPNSSDVFVKDLVTGQVIQVVTSATGEPGQSPFGRDALDVSFIGSDRVAFTSFADNLTPGDADGAADLFIKTLSTGAVTRVELGGGVNLSEVVFSRDAGRMAFARDGVLTIRDLATGAETIVDTPLQTNGYPVRFSPDGASLVVAVASRTPFPGPLQTYLVRVAPGGGDDRLEGGLGDDVLEGGVGDDVLTGGSGFDTASYEHATAGVTVDIGLSRAQNTGGAGTDVLFGIEALTGSDFDDVLMGAGGNDTLDGRYGSDRIDGQGGDDLIRFVGDGRDVVAAGDGDDLIAVLSSLQSNAGHLAVVNGGAGRDVLDLQNNEASNRTDIYIGRQPPPGSTENTVVVNDVEEVRASPRGPSIRFYSDFIRVFGSENADRILGGSEVRGFGGNDTLTGVVVDGGAGDDVIEASRDAFGGDGDDVIRVTGPGVIDGGLGRDTLILEGATPFGRDSYFVDQTLGGVRGVEVITGGSGADRFRGGDEDNQFSGGDGQDQLTGLGGNDVLLGGAQNDTLSGGGGDDVMDGGAGDDLVDFSAEAVGVVADVGQSAIQNTGLGRDRFVSVENLTGTRFNDALTGSAAANVLYAGEGTDIAWGGDGDDQVFMKNGVDQAFGDGGADYMEGGGGDDRLCGGQGNDWLEGDYQGPWFDNGPEGNDQLFGDEGNDVVRGNAGNDELYGVSGDDRLDGGAGDDRLDGGDGIDTVSFDGAFGAVVDLGRTSAQDTRSGRDVVLNVENATGTAGSDALTGSSGNNVLYAAEGDDFVWGEGGDDQIFSKNGRDQAFAGDGADYLEGGGGDDVLYGGQGNDWVEGDYQGPWFDNGPSGNDRLFGDEGDDVIQGGEGSDIMTGGAGADRFLFRSANDSTAAALDRVTDFNGYVDRMDLSRIDADLNAAGDQAFRFVAQFSDQAGQALLTYDAGRNVSTLSLDVNGDSRADFVLELNGAHSTELGWVL